MVVTAGSRPAPSFRSSRQTFIPLALWLLSPQSLVPSNLSWRVQHPPHDTPELGALVPLPVLSSTKFHCVQKACDGPPTGGLGPPAARSGGLGGVGRAIHRWAGQRDVIAGLLARRPFEAALRLTVSPLAAQTSSAGLMAGTKDGRCW